MIHILHGEDNFASYKRLSALMAEFNSLPKIYVKPNDNVGLQEVIYTQDFINPKKLIIAEGFFTAKKVNANDVKKIKSDHEIIFWEKKELTKNYTKDIGPNVILELFKQPSSLYSFLDNLQQSKKFVLDNLIRLEKENGEGLLWQVQNRLLMLIFAKLNFNKKDVVKITDKNLQDWQWQKLVNQSKSFDLEILNKLFTSSLRADYLIKSGQTSLSPFDLMSILFIKYSKG